MKYRKFGETGLDVSILSFGASSLGSVFHETDEAESIQTVHAAMDAGINLIDVSPYYGMTKAETVLGKAIAQMPRDQFYLSTKAGRYGSETFDFTGKRLLASVEESLQRLHTDYVDILFLHDIEFVPFEEVSQEAFYTLEKLKEQGKIRFAGVSGLPLSLFEKTIAHQNIDAILSYCHYSLNDTSLLDIVPLLEQHNVGLMNASPLSMGLLNSRSLPDWHPASDEIKRICKDAAQYCAEQGEDIAKLAIQFSTRNEQIPTTLVSTANRETIRKNAVWTEEPIDQDLLAEVLRILEPIHNRSWVSGLPEYNQGGIIK